MIFLLKIAIPRFFLNIEYEDDKLPDRSMNIGCSEIMINRNKKTIDVQGKFADSKNVQNFPIELTIELSMKVQEHIENDEIIEFFECGYLRLAGCNNLLQRVYKGTE